MNTIPSQRSFNRLLACLIAAVALLLPGMVAAQNLNVQLTQANQAWENREYEKCQALFERITNSYGARAPMLYGPKFGFMWYRKGICELKLANIAKRKNNLDDAAKWYEKAAKSFETCYKKFPNGAPGMAQSTNVAHKASLQRWGEARMGLKEYQEALKLFEKFQAEREDRDKFLPTPGGFYINLAICNFLMDEPKIPAGIRHFETAIKNKEKMRTSDAGIVACFLAFSQAVIEKKNESAMIDFLGKNRADITLPPFQLYEYSPVFLKLAGNALEAEMYKAAFNLYAMIPDTNVVIQDIQVRLDQLAGRKGVLDGRKFANRSRGIGTIIEASRLESGLSKLQAKARSGDPDDVKVLTAMAFLHDQAKNQRGVYGALEQLELFYNKSKKREQNLFSLVRVASLIGEVLETEHYGSIFLKDFPESDKVESVRRMMLTSLFFGGEYEKSLEVAKVLLDKVAKGSKQHDICVFVLGGSHFYLGNFDEAQPFLDQHTKEYPKSDLIMHSLYFQAANLTRLQYWERAATLLDAFLEKYPSVGENIYLPNALYDRANCHFAENELDPALRLLNRLENEFASTAVIDMAYNMKGNIFESRGEIDDAEKYYLLALEVAEKRENDLVAGEALSFLVGMLGVETRGPKKVPNPRIKDAVPHYDKFLKEYSDSPYKPQVVVYGMPAMRAVGREQEGLDNLQAMITFLANDERQFYLEEVVNAFSKAFLEKKGNDLNKLKALYQNFPGINLANKKTLALLRIALISLYEEAIAQAEKEGKDDLVGRYKADIGAQFRNLKAEFKPQDLVNSVLMRVANYLRLKTSAPKQSLPYYEELLKREDKGPFEFRAMLGIADVLGRSDNSADNKKAIAQLEEVAKRAKEDPKTLENARFRMVEISAKIEDWDATEKFARAYLDAKHTKNAPDVSFMFAVSFDKRNQLNDALVYYSAVYSRYMGYIRISAPSTLRVMQIMWDRNLSAGAKVGDQVVKLGDRQEAYQTIGFNYVRATRKIRENNTEITEAEKEAWDKVAALVKEFEGSGQVKTMDVVEKERLEKLRGR